jgi:hypothetical protein
MVVDYPSMSSVDFGVPDFCREALLFLVSHDVESLLSLFFLVRSASLRADLHPVTRKPREPGTQACGARKGSDYLLGEPGLTRFSAQVGLKTQPCRWIAPLALERLDEWSMGMRCASAGFQSSPEGDSFLL